MELTVLGPVAVSADGVDLDLGTPRQRTLVAALALSGGRPVGVDTIVDLVWGDTPPPGVATTLQAYVSGLRKVLEPGRARRAPAEVLVTVAPGYALKVPPEAVDAHAFEREVAAAHRLLEAAEPTRAELEEVDATLGTAL
ncbi:MAG: winged helix-turn-helix domain-containing protein, partial [Aeromicrobium sp.]